MVVCANLAMKRHTVERNWRAGRGAWSTICFSDDLEDLDIWRFKFNPDWNYWACTSQRGQVQVFSPTPSGYCRRWEARPEIVSRSIDIHSPPLVSQSQCVDALLVRFTHLESSGPFIVTNNHGNRFNVWQRIGAAFTIPVPVPSSHEDQFPTILHGDEINPSQLYKSAPMFAFRHSLLPPAAASCFKARSPFLAAASYVAHAIYIWNLESGTLVEEYNSRSPFCF